VKADLSDWSAIAPPETVKKLKKAGIERPLDLLLFFPASYRGASAVYSKGGKKELTSVDARMESVTLAGTSRQHILCKAKSAEDGSPIEIRYFNYNTGMQARLARMREVTITGDPAAREGLTEFVHPRVVPKGSSYGGSPAPQYPAVRGVKAAEIRKMIAGALESYDLQDTVPGEVLDKLKLPTFREALTEHHRPKDDSVEQILDGSHRSLLHLKFSEWLAYLLLLGCSYKANRSLVAPPIRRTGIVERVTARLPFSLTGAQGKALEEILGDLEKERPMRRLLHGDVGSGKTIIAGLACAVAADSGHLAAFMAPTELLAEQHRSTLAPILEPCGIGCELITGSVAAGKRRKALDAIGDGERQVIFGTHALFQEKVELPPLGIAVVDEQQRFGVRQRDALAKKGKHPHQLMLSATPIPRTLSLAIFSDLDVSTLDEKPPGRAPVSTQIYRSSKRKDILDLIERKMEGQVYWVCPLVKDSEKQDLLSAETLYAQVQEEHPGIPSGLIHGRMSAAEKAAVLASFKAGEIRLAVATTVVEVGIDAPEADVMVIEHAERMGLSQMHQLRGRVGRGGRPGYCLLLYSKDLSADALRRIQILRESADGFKIALEDLKIRGFGELVGGDYRQSGMRMRFIDPLVDNEVAEKAKKVADIMIGSDDDRIDAHIMRWLGRRRPSG